jgi:hypothetical protein
MVTLSESGKADEEDEEEEEEEKEKDGTGGALAPMPPALKWYIPAGAKRLDVTWIHLTKKTYNEKSRAAYAALLGSASRHVNQQRLRFA